MSLSSNTLIHFTNSKENLKKILEENFRVFNCRETVVLGGQNSTWHLPMVSFCDIPLSEVKNHISKYGEYGLGMTKEWGMRRGLNPVLYVAQQSILSESYRTAWNYFNMESDEDVDEWSSAQKALADVLRYIKNYEADLTRHGTTTKNYRFSDEREWRFVPPYTEDCEMLMHTDYYTVGNNQTIADRKLNPLRLTFEPSDIKYIIIRDDSEIAEFIDHLRRAKGKSYSLHDLERLTTRILTTEQIMGDI